MNHDQLILRYLDDRSSLLGSELDSLIALLRAEPARAGALREQLLLDDLLAQKLAVDRKNFEAQVGQRIADFERGQDELDQQVSELRALAEAELERPQPWSGSSPWVKYVLALAAATLIGGAFLASRLLPKQPQLVAKVTAVEGAVSVVAGGQSLAAAVNSGLLSGQQLVVPAGASVEIAYQDSTTVRLAGSSAVTLDIEPASGAKRVEVARGEVLADIRPQTAGAMTFSTPHAVATVLGTRLRLLVSESQTRLDVTRGRVQFDRLHDNVAQVVAANQTGLATKDELHVRTLEWPVRREGLAYLLSPLEVTPEDGLPTMAARNPATGNLRKTDLTPRGEVELLAKSLHWELRGGHLFSDEAGTDLLAAFSDASEFTLEIVFTPGQSAGTLAALGASGSANFALSQSGRELLFSLRTADGAAEPLRIPLLAADEPLEAGERPRHMAITCRGGELIAFLSGAEVARSATGRGSLAGWREGPLTVGADARGGNPWRGRVAALALYARCHSPDEVARSAASFRLLTAGGR